MKKTFIFLLFFASILVQGQTYKGWGDNIYQKGYWKFQKLYPLIGTDTIATRAYSRQFGGASGSVTSVGLSVPTGLSISGSPVTSSGTLTLTYTSGYSIPSTSSQSNWTTAYGWGNHASAGYLTSQTSHADVVVDGDFSSNGILKRTSSGSYGIVTDNSSNWNFAYSQAVDTGVITDNFYLKAELYTSDQVDSIAALKAALASPTFTGKINITPVYTGNLFIGNGGTNLVSKPGDLSKYNTGIGREVFLTLDSGYYNTASGYYSMGLLNYGYRNTASGAWSMAESEGAYNNVAMGYNSLYKVTGYANSSIGSYSMNLTTTGSQNSVLGGRALYTNVSGNRNLALGYEAGYEATGSGNIFLGPGSGYKETGSNTLLVSTTVPADEAEGRSKAIIYAGLNSITANQFFEIHAGRVSIKTLSVYADNTAALAGGLVAGDLYRTSTGVLMITY